MSADALKASLLQHAQEDALRLQGQFANFVQEERSAVGDLEESRSCLGRAGERALLVAEETAFQKVGGHIGAVEGDERLAVLTALRLEVNLLGDRLLARAALAENQDSGVFVRCYSIDSFLKSGDGVAFANQLAMAIATVVFNHAPFALCPLALWVFSGKVPNDARVGLFVLIVPIAVFRRPHELLVLFAKGMLRVEIDGQCRMAQLEALRHRDRYASRWADEAVQILTDLLSYPFGEVKPTDPAHLHLVFLQTFQCLRQSFRVASQGDAQDGDFRVAFHFVQILWQPPSAHAEQIRVAIMPQGQRRRDGIVGVFPPRQNQSLVHGCSSPVEKCRIRSLGMPVRAAMEAQAMASSMAS